MPQPLNLLQLQLSLFLQQPPRQKFPSLKQLCKQSRMPKKQVPHRKLYLVRNSDPAKVRDITL